MASKTSLDLKNATDDVKESPKVTEYLKNVITNIHRPKEDGQNAPGDTLSKSKNTISSRIKNILPSGDACEIMSDPKQSVVEASSKKESLTLDVSKIMNSDSESPRMSKSRCRCKDQDTIQSLCAEIERITDQLGRIKKQIAALDKKKHCCSTESMRSSDRSLSFNARSSEIPSVNMESDPESVTFASSGMRRCGCSGNTCKSPNQRSKGSSRSSYQPISVLRHPQKSQQINLPSSIQKTIDHCGDTWYTHLSKLKNSMDEKHSQMKELWAKPFGDFQEAGDISAGVSYSAPDPYIVNATCSVNVEL